MNRIVAATLLTLTCGSASILFTQPALADIHTVCYPVTQSQISQDDAAHPGAYRDGYREGRESARNGEAYKPRTAGGEFARGFDDGYYGRRFSGQQYRVPNRVNYYTTQRCNSYSTFDPIPYRVNPWRPFRYRRWGVRW